MLKRIGLLTLTGLLVSAAAPQAQLPAVQFIFTSDVHFGITRTAFRGATTVPARIVNAAQAASMNALPGAVYPRDGALRAGQPVGPIDFVAEAGDIANRAETTGADAPIQSAAQSWAEFTTTYLEGLTLKTPAGGRTPFFMVPGNHDLSNAIGYPRPMAGRDSASMIGIFNWMVKPAQPRTTATFDPARDRVLASRDVGGVHLQFIPMWPDTGVRAWMEADLRRVSKTTPVLVFAHDGPDVDTRHLRNPNGTHDINGQDRFENVVDEMPAAGTTVTDVPVAQRRALEQFLVLHPNVTAYFHGHTNFTQFYDWSGPGHTASLHVFRVDSPMKGDVSAADETKMSYQVATIDPVSKMLTVREVLWNATRGAGAVTWGASTTVALQPRPAAASSETH